MNNQTMQYQWHFLKNSFSLLCFILIISCNSSKKTQEINAAVKNEKSGTIENNFPTQNEEGVDFFAINSSWTLSLDFEGDFQFKRDDGFVFSTPAVESHRAQDSNVIRYRAQVESGEMIIQVYEEECIDNRTGQKFPNRVTVEIRRGIDKDFMEFQGCGSYIFDQRIHGIWVLDTLNTTMISGKVLPYIEFNTTDGTVLGNTGCNNFSGKASLIGNKLTIKPLAVTRKFCQEAALEGEFLKAISQGEMEYRVDNGKLFLSRNGIETIVFRKVD